MNEVASTMYGRPLVITENDYICHKCLRKAEALVDLKIKVRDENEFFVEKMKKHLGSRKRPRSPL